MAATSGDEMAAENLLGTSPGNASSLPRTMAIPGEEPTRQKVRKRIIDLAGPTLVEMFLVTFVQMIDMMMVGHVGPAAVAAVGLTNQPILFALSAFMALNVGTTAIVARSIGAGDRLTAERAATQTLVITVLLAVLVAGFGFHFAREIILLMGAGPDVVRAGTGFMQLVSLSLIFSTIGMSVTAVLRGAGDTKTPMWVNALTNVLVIIGDYVFIYGHLGFQAMGAVGAGWATLLARVFSAAIFLYLIISRRSALTISWRGYRYDAALVGRILKVGFPAALEQFAMRGGMLTFVRIVASLGTVTYAAHQIALNVLGLSFMPGMAFGMAATTLVGQNLGAKRPDWAEKSGYETRYLGMILATFMGAVFFLGGPWIMRLYTNEPEVIHLGSIALKIIGLVQPAQSTQFVLAGGLRGAGDTRWPLYATTAGVWGVRLTLASLLVLHLNAGLTGAWIAMAVDQFARSLFIGYRYKSGKWKAAKV